MQLFVHQPVLLEEVIAVLAPHDGGYYVDATVGGGGHAEKMLQACAPGGRLIGIDQDEDALAAARERLAAYGERVRLFHANFRDLDRILRQVGVTQVDGILFDLGVSSPQVDQAARGFSYRKSGPLDMRMDQHQLFSAYDLVNEWPQERLAAIFRTYGEERYATSIAKAIVAHRQKTPIRETGELDQIVREGLPPHLRQRAAPSKRVFQAIRIAVNDELSALRQGLEAGFQWLAPQGRMVVLSFHSLEDRLVKQFFAEKASGCTCPPDLPVCVCGHKPQMRLLLKKPLTASEAEVEHNPRAHSAKLRAAIKTG